MMKTRCIQTKTDSISNELREDIVNGKFQDGRLPSKADLITHFNVSHRTIDAVLKLLREEGLIRGVRGTGIFVKENVESVNNLTHRLVLMLLPKYSIYENEPYESLRAEALRRGVFPINLNMPDKEQCRTLQERAALTQLLRAPIRGVLYNGKSYNRDPFLKNWTNINSVALVMFDSEDEPPGSSLVLDFRNGAYHLAQHFIENGAKRMAILAGHIAHDVPKSEKYWKNHISTQFKEGISKAAAEAGLSSPDLYFCKNLDLHKNEFLTLLQKYDSILCTSDFLAHKISLFATEEKIRIPEDLLISGVYDTFWSHSFAQTITTLGINPGIMSEKAFDILEAGGVHHERILPELIIRASTQR